MPPEDTAPRPTSDLPAWLALAAGSLLILLWQIHILHGKYRAGEELVASDGRYYYVYLPSLVLDHDLDFANDYELVGAHRNLPDSSYAREGYLTNLFTSGPAFLWLPFFLLGHLATLTVNLFGAAYTANGYGPLEMGSVILGNCLYGCAGLFFLFATLRRRFDPFSSVMSVLAVAFCTAMLFYFGDRAFFPNATQLLAISLLLDRSLFVDPQRMLGAPIRLGAALGMVALLRATDALLVIVPIVTIVRGLRQELLIHKRALVRSIAVATVVALALSAPKLYVKQTLNPHGDPRFWSGYLHPAQPFFFEQLFSTRRGLLPWAPVLWLALAGFCFLWRRERVVVVSILGAAIVLLYVNGISADWWGGRSPGTRRLTNLLPLLAVPLAACIQRMTRKGSRVWVAALLALFAADNWLMYRLFVGDPAYFRRSVAFEDVVGKKVSLVVDAIGYPAGFPGSLLTAWRYGVSVKQAELAAGVYLDTDFDELGFGADADYYLGRGWSGRPGEEEEGVAFRQTEGTEATLLVGRLGADAQMRRLNRLLIRARASGAASLQISLNGSPLACDGPSEVDRDWRDVRFRVDASRWVGGINEIALSVHGKGRRLNLSVDRIAFAAEADGGG